MTIWSSSKPTTPTSQSTTSRSARQAHTAGAIVIIRDPRDIALSYSAFIGKPLDDIITFMANPRAANRATTRPRFSNFYPPGPPTQNPGPARHAKSCSATRTSSPTRKNISPASSTTSAARPSPERLRRAIAFSDFHTLSAQETQHGYTAGGPAGPFFRAGKSGAWRDALTPAQAARIENDHRHVMRKFGYVD